MMGDPKGNDNNNNDNSNKPRRSDESNPFISFRRYADEQISALMSGVLGLPGAWHKDERSYNNNNNNSDEEAQSHGRGKHEVWVREWSSDKTNSDNNGGSDKQQRDEPSSWARMWNTDGQEVKPEVVEDKDGGKTYHWSWSWSWPPKGRQDEQDELDAKQRKALEEARRNAERELQELSDAFKGFFGADDAKEDSARGQNLLDWVWPGEGEAGADKRAEMRREMEDRIKRLEDEFFNVRDSFKGFGGSPWSHFRVSDEARDGSQILQLLDDLHSNKHPFSFPMMRGWGHPLSYLLDYSNPRTRWVLEHPYSPAVLEVEASKGGTRVPRYADAFEDLMRAERGLPPRDLDWDRSMWPRSYRLLSNVYSQNPKTQEFWQNVEQGGEWYVTEKAKSLSSPNNQNGQKQLGAPSESAVEAAAREQEARDHMYERFLGTHTTDPKTELDMYERFLGDTSSNHPASQSKSITSPPNIDVASSPILSTVTTTERNVAPDGTVTTKVTLKKRFADGREETSETVNTSRGDGTTLNENTTENKKRSGWFWSN